MQAVFGTLLAALALSGATPTLASGQADPAVAVRTVRFFRADPGQTRVKAFLQIPYALLTPGSAGSPGEGRMGYEVAVKVVDTSGLTLHQDAWRNEASAALRGSGASAMEIMDFLVAPGRYRLEFTVTDQASGTRYTGQAEVRGFAERPAVSDLLLSPVIRTATPSDTVPVAGELGFGPSGEILVAAATTLELSPLRSVAHYLLETYSEEAAGGSLALSVRNRDGQVVYRTPAVPVNVVAGGQVLTGQLDLAGLPAGEYELVAQATIGGASVERVAPIRMAELEATLQREVARQQADRVSDEGYFRAMSREELDEAKAPLEYAAESGDNLGDYDDLLSVEARRQWLTEFWQKRDPDPSTLRNEVREQFYAAVAYANEHYRERGRAGREGWRTDRGRVYARYGAPTEVLQRLSSGKAPPYEVWHNTRQRDLWFIFVDRTRLDSYNLICSNDRKETCRPDWREIVGEDAVQDIGRFLGVDFYTRQNPIN